MKNIDKYRGCMIGGAVGDALGYAVEFLDEGQIFKKFGKSGITEYVLNKDGKAEISDDTQMSLFTANGLLFGATRYALRGFSAPYECYIEVCYIDWLKTQRAEEFGLEAPETSWLNNIPDMNHCRAPGMTCLSALNKIVSSKRFDFTGSIEKPINDSKGCGGVMRVAPVGLFLGNRSIYAKGKKYDMKVDMVGAEVAAITHGHELGYIPAAALVRIIDLVSHTKLKLKTAVLRARAAIIEEFPDAKHIGEMVNLIDKAVALSKEERNDLDAIHELGQGWVAEETLAIAIYCALKYQDDFEKAIVASVNHRGDSDSTGALTGNILGAYLGLSSIPKKFIDNLELKDVILEIADDLFNDCQLKSDCDDSDPIWLQKYVYRTYPQKRNARRK